MKIFLKTVLITIAGLLTVSVALLLYILFGDLSVHKNRVLAIASDATGFALVADGPFDLEVGGETRLSVGGLVVVNPGWRDDVALANVGSLNVVVDTWSLFSGPVDVLSIELSDAEIRLIEDGAGHANWIVAGAEPEESASESEEPIIREVRLADVQVVRQVADLSSQRLDIWSLEVDLAATNEYRYSVSGRLDDESGFQSVSAAGVIEISPAISELSALRVEFEEAAIEVGGGPGGGARFTGHTALDFSGDKPVVQAEIDVSELMIVPAETESADPEDDGDSRLFSTEPLELSWLHDLDLDAKLTIAEANWMGNSLRSLELTGNLEDGALILAPVGFETADGFLLGSVTLLPGDNGYELQLELVATNLRLAQLADGEQAPETIPPINATINLTGSGNSMAEIMASSNGQISGRQDSGQLNLQAVSVLYADIASSILSTLNPLAEEQTYANVECGVFEVTIVDGIADVAQLAIQSDRLTIVASGEVNLETEEVDLVLRTKSRQGLGISVGGVADSLMKLGGTLSDPALGIDATGSVTTTGAAIATGGLSILAGGLWDRVTAEVDICSQAEE